MQNRLKELRKAKGFTQQQFAEIVGISQSYVSDIEKGKRDIDFTLAKKFADTLNVKPFELMPLDWQPKQITPAERQLLDMIKKTVEPSNPDTTDTAKAE